MKRREWMGAAGALAATAALERHAEAAAAATDAFEIAVVRLHLRHTWTTTMSSS